MDSIKDKVYKIESICATDVGRNINELASFVEGDLFLAAESVVNHLNPKVVIVTGFFIHQANPPAPETDGIPGAVVLAKALDQLGIAVELITDEWCIHALRYAVSQIGYFNQIRISSISSISGHSPLEKLCKQQEKQLLTHIIYIERAGPGRDGNCFNMSGQNIDKWTAPLHELLIKKRSLISIAVGDGGNEIGMGKIPSNVIKDNILKGSQIGCVVPCDFLLVAGVSNWGVTALLLSMALVKPEWKKKIRTVLKSDFEYKILRKMTRRKLLVDGVTKRFKPTVDGLKWCFHQKIYQKMIQTAKL